MDTIHPRYGSEKHCPRCDQMRPIEEFRPGKDYPIFPRTWCASCHTTYHREQRRHNPEPNRESASHRSRQRLYGIRPADYERMRRKQGNVCAICGQPETKKIRGGLCDLAVDHDHATGQIRGLLCAQCNHGLGNFRDNVELMRKAIKYLQKAGRQRS